MTDDELQDVLQDLQTNITVVGCGGAGGNTVNRMTEEGIHGAKLVAANTDVQHLVNIEADTKILYGPAEDARSAPAPSRRSVRRPPSSPKRRSRTPSTAPTWCSSPPGSAAAAGTGSAPVVAKAARESGALTIAIVTTPPSLPRARSDERTPRPASNGSAT